MIGTHEMDDLSSRLIAFGDALAFDDAQLVDSVLRRVEAARPRSIHRRWLAVAAIIVAVALAGRRALPRQPARRGALAGSRGREHRGGSRTVELAPSSFELPGPGRSRGVRGERIADPRLDAARAIGRDADLQGRGLVGSGRRRSR